VRGSIRKTDFTWDPERQSRQEIWKQLKDHIQSELDRIERASKQDARRRRIVESPFFHRDRSLLRDHEVHGVDIPTLARRHALSAVRVREVIRMARYRERMFQLKPRLPQAPDTELPQRGLPERAREIPQTGSMLKDP
jgi:hypothetical protein